MCLRSPVLLAQTVPSSLVFIYVCVRCSSALWTHIRMLRGWDIKASRSACAGAWIRYLLARRIGAASGCPWRWL
jgi:hypothetical protein